MLGELWPGWALRWAHEGVVDFVHTIGGELDAVIDRYPQHLLEPRFGFDCLAGCISVRNASGTLAFWPISVLRHDIGIPEVGLHIDRAARTVELWCVHWLPDHDRRLAHAWPGWQICWARDRFEAQLEATSGLLRFSEPSRDALVADIREELLADVATLARWEPRGPHDVARASTPSSLAANHSSRQRERWEATCASSKDVANLGRLLFPAKLARPVCLSVGPVVGGHGSGLIEECREACHHQSEKFG